MSSSPTPTPQDRATAERIARETWERTSPLQWSDLSAATRQNHIQCVLEGLAHRDRIAEREAARKAWDAACESVRVSRLYEHDIMGPNGPQWGNVALAEIRKERDRYLAAEFDAGERVTLSDGSVVTRSGYIIRREHADEKGAEGTNISSWELLIRRTDTGADFDAVKRLAEQRGAER